MFETRDKCVLSYKYGTPSPVRLRSVRAFASHIRLKHVPEYSTATPDRLSAPGICAVRESMLRHA